MKKLTRKLFISILAAVFAVVALGTSTFAWITISNTASVEAFTGEVDAGESGIELNTTNADTGWTNKLTITEKGSFVKFSDITSEDGKNFKKIKISEGKPAEITTVGDQTQYIQFSVWVRNANKLAEGELEVYIDDSKVSFASSGTGADGNFNSDLAGGAVVPGINVSNAARMSFEVNTVIKTTYEQKAGVEDNTNGFDPVSGFAWTYLKGKKFAEYVDEGNKGNLPNIKGEAAPKLAPTRKAGDTGKQLLLTLNAREPQEIIVRVWVEGWDNECHHNILGQTLTTAFAFSSKVPDPVQ